MHLGYYFDPNRNDLRGYSEIFSHSQDPNECFDRCEKKGFEFAAIKYEYYINKKIKKKT